MIKASNKNNIQKYEDKIIKYLLDNENFFINIFEEFNKNFTEIPNSVGVYPFIKDDSIDSLIAFTDSGYYYILINENYLHETASFISNKASNIFSIYGYHTISERLIKLIKKPYRYFNTYFAMKLVKNNYNPVSIPIDKYYCIKCNINHFDKLKDIQYLYHKEEVYDENSYYPYKAEMKAFKEVLSTRLNYAVFSRDKKNIAVSKCNVNGESPNLFQLGGIFTKKEFRNKGFSKLCLTYLINEIFDKEKKSGIILYVKKDNKAAVNLYLKLGFTIEYESILCYY